MTLRPRSLLSGIALASVAGCGPSFQAIYEGDARFEHCYALDETANVSMKQKGECWRDWLARYTYGQTRDRVAYASARAEAIHRAPALPTDEALMHAAPGEVGPRSGVVAPAPTSMYAPPPKTLGDAADGGAPSTNAPSGDWASQLPPPEEPLPSKETPESRAERPPLADCTDDCQRSWSACRASCADPSDKACGKCTTAYKACLKVCAK